MEFKFNYSSESFDLIQYFPYLIANVIIMYAY